MNSRMIIDEAGRVMLPKPLRDELHLEPGDAIDIESAGEQITLRPVREESIMRKEQGIPVFYTGEPISVSTTNEILEQIREERERANLGEPE
jgi:AbrB family looped-hinge helix DNA binding protein